MNTRRINAGERNELMLLRFPVNQQRIAATIEIDDRSPFPARRQNPVAAHNVVSGVDQSRSRAVEQLSPEGECQMIDVAHVNDRGGAVLGSVE